MLLIAIVRSIVWTWKGWTCIKKVRQGYLSLLNKEGNRIVKIDASFPLEQVVETTKAVLFDRMGLTK